MPRSSARALRAYWRQVHQVQRITGAPAATARRVVRQLRSHERSMVTAAATKRHPRIVNRFVRETIAAGPPPDVAPYADLDEFIDAFDEWDYDYLEFDVETNADY